MCMCMCMCTLFRTISPSFFTFMVFVMLNICQAIRVLSASDDQNCYDATDVVLQSRREAFEPHNDYLDMMMQVRCW